MTTCCVGPMQASALLLALPPLHSTPVFYSQKLHPRDDRLGPPSPLSEAGHNESRMKVDADSNGLHQPERLHRQIAIDDIADAVRSGVRNWAWSIWRNLADIGYVLEWREGHMPSVRVDTVLHMLRGARRARCQAVDICPRTAPSDGVMMCTYMRWFAGPAVLQSSRCRGQILGVPVRARQMRKFIRFRLGCHELPVEMGRRAGVLRRNRLCTRCSMGLVGDEKHMIFECPAVGPLRNRYAPLFLAGGESMQAFLWQKDMVGVVRFVLAALEVMRDDPVS